MSKDDGGFVYARSGNGCEPILGITRRDDLAKAAMIGELASQNETTGMWTSPFESLAKNCYEIADAMIAEGRKE